MGLLFWHCVHDQWTRFDRLSPDKFLMFQLLYHNLYQVQLMKIANFSSWNIARISESVSIKVALFHVPLFPTLINQAKHCFYSPVFRPSQKSQSVWTPGSLVTHQTQIVLIAAHSLDIFREFSGRWKVLQARIYTIWCTIITRGDNRTWIWTVAITLVLSSLVHSSLKVHFSYRLKFLVYFHLRNSSFYQQSSWLSFYSIIFNTPTSKV